MTNRASKYSNALGLYVNCEIDNGSVSRVFVTMSPRFAEEGNEILDRICEYLSGEAVDLSDIPIEPRGTDFQKKVWSALMDIPRGEVRTYSEIARVIGKPKGARAVGNAVGSNHLLILVPCHRVVAKHGLGGFSAEGGIETKMKILALEKVPASEVAKIAR
ncbi:hypothetical protein IX51_02215 [uncultured archaeon]|nr:hypothetical protein IX51_02215 [uncultured archaeon]